MLLKEHWAVVVAQLVERSLPTPEIRGSNPVIRKNLSINLNKTQNITCDLINDSEISDNIKIIKIEEIIAESDISDNSKTEDNISDLDNAKIEEYNENDFIKKRKKKIVNYIQQYDVNGNLIKYYESFIDLIRDIPGTSVSGLKHSMNK